MEMKKTSVYLSQEDRERLARLAERKGESQAWVLREALLAYDASLPDRNYAMFEGLGEVPVAERLDPEELQAYNDELDRVMREGLREEYERQVDEALRILASSKPAG